MLCTRVCKQLLKSLLSTILNRRRREIAGSRDNSIFGFLRNRQAAAPFPPTGHEGSAAPRRPRPRRPHVGEALTCMRVPGRRALRSAFPRARWSSARSLENSPRSPWRIVESGRPAGNPRPDFWPILASSLPSWKVAPPPTGAEGRPHFSLRPSQPRPARGAPCRLSPRGTSQTCPSFQRHRRPPRWPPRLRPEPQHSFLPAAARGLGKSQIQSWFSLLRTLDGVPRDRKPNPSASPCPPGQPASPRRHRPGHSSSSPVAGSASSHAVSTLPAPGPCARCTCCLAGRSRARSSAQRPLLREALPAPHRGRPLAAGT